MTAIVKICGRDGRELASNPHSASHTAVANAVQLLRLACERASKGEAYTVRVEPTGETTLTLEGQ